MRRFLSIVLALGLILGFSLVTAVPALAAPEVWVDDDSPNDPGSGTQVDPYRTIQLGITYVDPGGTVHVADGIYTENIVISTDGIQLLGAGAGVTTINAGGGHVVETNGLSSTTLIDGFTITGGDTDYGGGMYNYGYSSPIVSNCIFTGNHASNRGGGMYNLDHSSPLVVNCVFSNNSSDQGGGIGCRTNSSPTIVNCLIVGNTAVTGGGILSWSTPSPIITNCTIVDNTATGTGGGIYINGNSPTVTNNIIYDNTAASGGGIYVNTGATPYIDYNDVYYNTGGNYGGVVPPVANNISLDPAFVDEGTGDYHLDHSVPSPCIDFGSNGAVPADTADLDSDGDTLEPIPYDFDNDPRIYPAGGTVDMGADEYYVPPPPPPPSSAVGGEVYPIDKAALLLPWLGLGLVLILAAGGLILIRRRS